MRSAELQKKAASAERYPTVSAVADYGTIGTNPASNHGTVDAAAELRLPIFQGGRVHGDNLVADSLLASAKQQLEDLRARIDQEVRDAFLDLQDTAQEVSVEQNAIQLATQTLQQSRDRFASGVTDDIEVVQAQEALADASVLALSATWTGGAPSQIVGNSLDALVSMLSLDFIYARLRESTGTAFTEMVRVGSSWESKPRPEEIGEKLLPWLENDPEKLPVVVRNLFGKHATTLVPVHLGLHAEIGVIVAGSQRADFPQQAERLVLNVAANQAAIGLQGSNLLSTQRRVASELDQRVAQRTAELAAINEELRKEIAERKSAEERLRQEETELKRSEAHKAAILDSSLDCIVAMDHEGCITEFNPAAERTFGYDREKVVGKHLAEVIVPPSLRERHRAGFARHLATGESRVLGRRVEMTALCADGRNIPVEIAITRIQQDGPPSFTGYLRDITERKRNEEALLEAHAELARSEERWRSVFENSAIGVALTDLHGRFIAANPVFQRMVGYTEEELQQLSFIDITVEEDRNPQLGSYPGAFGRKAQAISDRKAIPAEKWRRSMGAQQRFCRIWHRATAAISNGSFRRCHGAPAGRGSSQRNAIGACPYGPGYNTKHVDCIDRA